MEPVAVCVLVLDDVLLVVEVFVCVAVCVTELVTSPVPDSDEEEVHVFVKVAV